MSELNLFQKLFPRKPSASMDDVATAGLAAESMSDVQSSAEFLSETETAGERVTAVQDVPPSVNTKKSEPATDQNLLSIPILGKRTVVAHQRIFAGLLALALVVLALVTFFSLTQTSMVSQQLSATGQALMQSQRLAKSVSQALVGSPQAFPDVKESAEVLAKSVRALKSGDEQMSVEALHAEEQVAINDISQLMERAEKGAKTVLGQQKILTQVGAALRTINRQSSDLLEIAETISSLKLQQNAAPTEISAAGQLVPRTHKQKSDWMH